MDTPRWTIYCHSHIDSGRRYIGLTKRTILQRWNDHYYAAKSTKNGRWHFPNAIRKYGKNSFLHEVLEVCTDLEVANLAEECWIELFETCNPAKGFNLAKGGAHIPHPIRKNPWNDPGYRARQTMMIKASTQSTQARANNAASVRTPEFREKQAERSRQAWRRPEVRAKHTDKPTGWVKPQKPRVSGFKGKKHSDDTIKRLSIASRRPQSLKAAMAQKAALQAKYEDGLTKETRECKKHGVQPTSWYLTRTKSSGRTHFLCRLCRREWQRNRRASARSSS